MRIEDKSGANVTEQAAELAAIPEFKKVSTFVEIAEGAQRKLVVVMYNDDNDPVGKLEFVGFDPALAFTQHLAATVFKIWPLEACAMTGQKIEDNRH